MKVWTFSCLLVFLTAFCIASDSKEKMLNNKENTVLDVLLGMFQIRDPGARRALDGALFDGAIVLLLEF